MHSSDEVSWRARVSSFSRSSRLNITGTIWQLVTWYRSTRASHCSGSKCSMTTVVQPIRSDAEPEHGPDEQHHRQRLARLGVRQIAEDALGLARRARRVEHGRPEGLVGDRVAREARDGVVKGFPAVRRYVWPGHQHALELRALRRGLLGHLALGGRAEQQPGG